MRGEAVTRLFALLRFLLPVLIDLLCLGLKRLLARSAIVLDQAAHLGGKGVSAAHLGVHKQGGQPTSRYSASKAACSLSF